MRSWFVRPPTRMSMDALSSHARCLAFCGWFVEFGCMGYVDFGLHTPLTINAFLAFALDVA